jgi:predicted phage terminase large subunit-like protein
MYRARQWFAGTDAHWDGANHRWMFPSGGSVNFGYLEHEGDELKYQSSEYQFIGFDELTHFPEIQYLYLFSRLRRLAGSPVPLRMRGATNPGGPGHEWVRKRWQLPEGSNDPDRVFVASFLQDNPFLDQEEYERSLELLGPVTKAQLLGGDWSATATGGFFDTSKFRIISWDQVPKASDFSNVLRYWDLGTTEPTELNPDPDYTVGLKIGIHPHSPDDPKIPAWYVFDVDRFRGGPAVVEQRIKAAAVRDGRNIPVWIEKEKGAAGPLLVSHYNRNVLPDFQVRGMPVQKTKEERAAQSAARVGGEQVFLVEGEYIDDFLAECGVYPFGTHDDQVDTLGYGMMSLEREAMLVSQGKVVKRGAEIQPVRRGRIVEPSRALGY